MANNSRRELHGIFVRHNPCCGCDPIKLLVTINVGDSLEFLHQSAFANFSVILTLFASATLENLNFGVYIHEWVRVLLIVHDTSPLTRILLLVRGHYGEFKVLVDGNTIIDGCAAAFLDVLASVREIVAAVSPAMCYDPFIQACSRNIPNGMMASIHHQEAGTPRVCLVITKRTERTRTQLGVNMVSSQRLFHLVITHLSMPYSIPAASLPCSTRRISRGHRHLRMEDCRGSEPIRQARFLPHVADIPRTTKAKRSIGVPSGGQHND